MKESLRSAFHGLLRLAPAFVMIPLILYVNAQPQQVSDMLIQSPAGGFIGGSYDYYPAYLDDEDIVIKSKVYVNEDGGEYYGAVIEIHKPVVLATPLDTGSMQPMFGAGNTLIQETVDTGTELNEGDIVVYEEGADLIIHQIVGEEDGCYITKGMNNAFPDPACVSKDKIRYRLLFAIPTK